MPAVAGDAASPGDAPIVADSPAVPSVTYRAMVAATAPVTFGGPTPTETFCTYQITLEQLVVELGITPAGHINRARVQDLNVETTTADCTFGTIPENVATYTLESAIPSATGLTLKFAGAEANDPQATLSVAVSAIDTGAPQAVLVFQRVDSVAPFNWAVTATLPLAPE